MTLRPGKIFGLLLIVGFGVLGGDSAADRAYYEQRMFVVTAPATREQLPSRVVHTTYLPVVTTQGPLGTCGAYGVTYYYRTFLKARQKGWVRPDPEPHPERCASTAYTYKLLRHDPLAGANILGTVMNMVDFGVCSLADMPYEYDMDTFTWPEEQYWKKAMPWRPRAAGQIPAIHTLAGQAVLKSHLHGGGAGDMAVIALRNAPNVVAYPEGMHTHNEVIYALQEAKSGVQHAFTVIGYDDNREYLDARDGLTKKGAFLAVNSWGQDWGVVLPEVGTGGFVWFAYDLFLKDVADDWNGSQAAAVMLERGEYAPQTMIRIGVTGDTRILSGGLSPSGEGGGEWIRLFPGLGHDAHPTDQGIWVDVTDMLASGSAGIRFHCWNLEGGPAYINDLKLASGDEAAELSWTGTEPVQLSSDYMAMTRLYVGRYQKRIPTPERAILTGDAAWFDWNGDGLPDAAVTSPEGTWLWTNTGSGRAGFTTTGTAGFPGGHTLRWLDANGDGHIDLLIASDTATTIYAGDGTGAFAQTFATLPACRRQAVAVADFNRDGRPDLVLGEAAETAVYLNTGTGFGKILQTLPALSSIGFGYGTLAVADVDGDGRPDLLLVGAGEAEWNTARTRLYRNAGLPLHFEEMATNLPAVKSPAVAFGDANGDGHPDLAISGCADPKWMRLYLNDGSGNFQERNTALPPLREGTLQWCDLDADGRPDLVATGATADNFAAPGPRTIAVINRPDGTFADFGLPLPNAYRGFLVAQDVTGDANPDLLVGGSTTWYSEPDPAKRVCALYDYSISQPGLFPVNTPPTAPDGLVCTHAGGGVFTFTWSPGTDAETPTAGLRYEWRCGRTAGVGDIVHGELARSGVQLRQPPVGTLHWQVRTVDSAGVTSAWSPVQEYVVAPYQLAYHLRLESSPAWGGTVVANVASPIGNGTAVTLTATAAPGFEFVGWQGDTQGLARGPTATFTIGEDRWIQAVFSAKASPVLPIWTLVRETMLESSLNWYYHTRDHTLESFGGKLVRLGGRKSDGYATDMILASTDNGATWQMPGGQYLPSNRYGHASAVYNGKLWVVGGVGGGGTLLTDVWHTTDLVTWTQATAAAPWPWREGASLVVANGKLWYLGGDKWGERYCDVWYSTDGANWTAVGTPAGWVQSPYFQAGDEFPWPVLGTGARVTVLNNVMYGTDGQSVWSSPDGVAWTLLAKEPDLWIPLPDGVVATPFGPLHKFSFTTYDGELVLLGGENWRLGETTSDVWSSPDGQAWTRTAPASRAHWSPRRNPATAVHNGKLFLVGGESAASAVLGDVWHCVPGEMPVGMGALVIEATPQTPWVGGTTEPRPGFYVDNLGKVFDIRAVPAYGYVLDRWEGPVVDDGDGDPCTVKVTLAGEETRVKAVFTFSVRLTVRTDPYGAGITVPEPQTAYAYPPNEWVAISAKAKEGYVFTHWTGPAENPNSANTRVFMDAAHEVVAMFRKMPVPSSMGCATDWAAVIRNGVVWGVGNNGFYQMGHDLPVPKAGEFWPVALYEGAKQVYAEDDGARVVGTDGTMIAWGSGYMHYLLGVRPHPSYLTVTNVAQCTGGWNLAGFFRKKDGTLVDYLNKAIQSGFGAGPLGDLIDVTTNGAAHFVVDSNGLLYAWGSNLGGQLGIPGVVSSDAPREVPGIDRVYATALGTDSFRPFTLALRNDGTVWSWGDPRGGQLGRVANEDEPAGVPAPVPGLADIVKIAAGSNHGLAMTHGGQLYAWGTNQFGQLGTGNYDNAATPVLVATPAPVVDVAAGPFYSLLHLADDTYCWMGMTPGAPDVPLTVPTVIPGLGAGYTEGRLATGTDPLDADGGIYPPPGEHPVVLDRPIHFRARDGVRHAFAHWSTNDTGQDVFLTLDGNRTITARFRFTYGTLARLTVETSGQGTTDPAPGVHEYAPGTVRTLTALPAAGHAFSHWEGAVAEPANNRTTVLLDRDRTVRACFVAVPQSVPPRVATGLGGYYDALVLRTDATVHNYRAAGGSSSVRLDTNNTPLTDCLNLAVGSSGLCLALTLDSTVWSWGGEAIVGGQNRLDGPTTFPGKVVESIGTLRNVLRIGAGDDFGLALLADGTLRTWGYNGFGQLGHSLAENAVPLARTVVEADGKPLTGIRAAACDGQFVVAVRNDGTVVAWGDNSHGQLGSQNVPSSGVPVVVPGLAGIVEVAAGQDFAAALDNSGRVWTWGRNDVGQCARGTRSGIAAPGQVAGLPAIAELALGRAHTLARDRDGGVWAWGSGADGRLGDGGTADRATPVRVVNPDGTGFLAGIVAVDCATYSYAIAGDGKIYAWGYSEYGVPYYRPVSYWNVGASDSAGGSLHALSLTCFPPEGGTLSPGAGTIFLSHGTSVTVSAVPAPGYRFQYWKGSVATTTERVLGLRLVGDTRLTAHFAPAAPHLRLGQGQGYAGGGAFVGVYLEGDTAPLEGISASFALPEGLSFAGGSRGTRLPESCLVRGSFPDARTATVLVSGTEASPILTPDADSPVYLLQVSIPPDCPAGDYPVTLLPVPAAAIAAGRAWVEPVGVAGRVTVIPDTGVDLLFAIQAQPGPENDQDEQPVAGIGNVRQGREYVAELWLRDQRSAGSPVADVRLDVGFAAAATCLGFDPVGLIDSPAGTIVGNEVQGFGGVPVGIQAPGIWYRLGALRFAATTVGGNVLTVDPVEVTVTLADASVLPAEVVEIWLDQARVEQQANQAPVARTAPPVVAAWGTQVFGQLLGSDANADDALVFTIVAGPQYGSVELDAATGEFLYTPLPYHTGGDSFTFTVTDGDLVSETITQNLYITTGWCATVNLAGDWAMLGREPGGSGQPDDPGDLAAAVAAPLAFVSSQGRPATRLQRDIRGDTGNVAWRLEVAAPATDTVLSWNRNQVPAGLRILRIEPVDCPLGGERSIDMFWEDSLPLAAGVAYRFDVAMPTDLALNLELGWNLVCLPGSPVFADPGLGQPAAPGVDSVWSWREQAYLAVDQVEPYTGYWFYTVQEGLQFFTVLPAFARDLPLEAGWNVIGVPRSVRVDTLLEPGTTVWRFRRLRYEPADWLDPGEGYWLYRLEPGLLDLTEDDE